MKPKKCQHIFSVGKSKGKKCNLNVKKGEDYYCSDHYRRHHNTENKIKYFTVSLNDDQVENIIDNYFKIILNKPYL